MNCMYFVLQNLKVTGYENHIFVIWISSIQIRISKNRSLLGKGSFQYGVSVKPSLSFLMCCLSD